jgi:thioredoxin 1
MKNRWFPAVALVTAVVLLVGLVGLIYSYKTSPSANVIEGTTANFEDTVLNSPLPVLIVFTTSDPQCVPCKTQEPAINKLADEYAGKVRVVRVDAMKQMPIAIAAGIQGIPTHIFLKPADGIGAVAEDILDEAQLRQFIEAGLKMQKPAQPDPAAPADPATGN